MVYALHTSLLMRVGALHTCLLMCVGVWARACEHGRVGVGAWPQVVIGGTNMNSEVGRLRSRAPDILVATPGRCLDHMTNDKSDLQASGARRTCGGVCPAGDGV